MLTVGVVLTIVGLCLFVLAPYAPRSQRARRRAEQKHRDCLRHIAALEADLGLGDGVNPRTTRATREEDY